MTSPFLFDRGDRIHPIEGVIQETLVGAVESFLLGFTDAGLRVRPYRPRMKAT